MIYHSASDNFTITPHGPITEVKGENTQYLSKDALGNLYCVQRLPIDLTVTEDAKEILRTAIKALILNGNKLTETTYFEYQGKTVAVDFSGTATSANRVLRGKMIYEDGSIYQLTSILVSDAPENIQGFDVFAKSFQLV